MTLTRLLVLAFVFFLGAIVWLRECGTNGDVKGVMDVKTAQEVKSRTRTRLQTKTARGQGLALRPL